MCYNTQDCYEAAVCDDEEIDGDAVVMAHVGDVAARYQIMKSNKLAGSGWTTTVTTSSSSRSSEILSIHPVTQQSVTKRGRVVITVNNDSSGLSVKKAKVSGPSARLEVPAPPALKRAEAILTNTILVLDEVPIVTSPQDIMRSLLSGLSISNFYICGFPVEITASIKVSVFVEFSSPDGAELGLRRSGESLVHRPIIADGKPHPHISTSEKHPARSQVSVHATSDLQAAWVRAVGWRLVAFGSNQPCSHSILSHMQQLGDFATRHWGLAVLSMTATTSLDDHWLEAMKLALKFHKHHALDAHDGTSAKVVVNQQDVGIVDRVASVTCTCRPIRADRLLHLLDGEVEGIPSDVGFALIEDKDREAGSSSYRIYRAALDWQHSLLSRSLDVAETEVCQLSKALVDLLLLTYSANHREDAAAPFMGKYVLEHINRRLTLCKHLCAQLRLACDTYVMHSCPELRHAVV